MTGEMVSFAGNGQTYQGYLARSAAGSGPGVIVIQEWWGLVGHIKDVADRFAELGFTALAPDFYLGQSASEPETAGKLMMALNIGETAKLLRGAIDRLLSDEACTGNRVGVVGFCMGGQLALFAAATNPEKIGACADYYGIHPNVSPPLEALNCELLGFFAEHDAYASPETVGKLSERLTALGKDHDFTTYPGTHHAFFNDERTEVYDRAAAEDSWKKMITVFRAALS